MGLIGSRKSGTQSLVWKRGVLVPGRFELSATSGANGVLAFRSLYRPRRPRAQLASAVSLFAVRHGLGLGSSSPGAIDELCGLVGVSPDGGAYVRSKRSRRATLALTEGAVLRVVIKLAPEGDAVLTHEIEMLKRVRGTIPGVVVPVMRWVGSWRDQLVVATDALASTDNWGDVSLEEALEIAVSLARSAQRPIVHGDFAPWNMVRTPDGIALVDWEASRFESDPLFDLAHFVTSSGALLKSYRPVHAVDLLTTQASPGWRYLEALELDPRRAPELVRHYLDITTARNRQTARYRAAMLDELQHRR